MAKQFRNRFYDQVDWGIPEKLVQVRNSNGTAVGTLPTLSLSLSASTFSSPASISILLSMSFSLPTFLILYLLPWPHFFPPPSFRPLVLLSLSQSVRYLLCLHSLLNRQQTPAGFTESPWRVPGRPSAWQDLGREPDSEGLVCG